MNNILPIWAVCLLVGMSNINAQQLQLNIDDPIERFTITADQHQDQLEAIVLGPLTIGHSYRLYSSDIEKTYFFSRQMAYPTFAEAISQFTAQAVYETLYLWRPTAVPDQDIHISIADLDLIHAPRSAASLPQMMGGIEVVRDTSVSQLVNAVFNDQSCFETFNAEFSGRAFDTVINNMPDTAFQLGTFSNGSTSVGFENGIILTTGRISNAEGPNDNNFRTQDYGTTSLDADMLMLSGGQTIHDMAVLEFEFRPTSDTIDFDYVFASEEYCEAFNETNTDVFAFFISGPGINGPFSDNAENIAVLPDGTTNVKVNTVNHLQNTAFFRNNVNPSFFLNCNLTAPFALDEIGYDGMTTILTARQEVIPCETYKLRMVIADVGDGFFDSAVMLVSGSFTAGLVNPEPLGVDVDSTANVFDRSEGCQPFEIALNRLNTNSLADSVVVTYSIATGSTATQNVDFTISQDSIVILPNQMADTLTFDILADGLPEGTEEIILQLQGTCNCDQNQVVIRINDSPQFNLSLDQPPNGCAGDMFELAPVVDGGFPGYTYLWEDGSTDSLRMITTSTGTAEYCVTITDACGFQDSTCVEVTRPAVSAQIDGTYSLCGGPVTIPVPLTGGDDFTVTVLEDGLPQVYTSSEDTLFLTYSSPVSLELVDVDANGCPGTVSGTAEVTTNEINVSADLTDVGCLGQTSGEISLTVNGNPGLFTYIWADPMLSGFELTDLPADTYDVRIEDPAGCFKDTSFTIVQPATAVAISQDSTQDQTCLQDGYLLVDASGGTGMLSYNWLDGPPGPERLNLPADTYTAIATDENGCADTLVLQVSDLRTTVAATISAPITQLDCQTNALDLSGPDNVGQTVAYQWTDENGMQVGDAQNYSATQAGSYTLTVTNPDNGCSATDQVVINQSDDLPQLTVIQNQTITCSNEIVELVVGINVNDAVDYSWSGPNGTPVGTNSPQLPNVSEAGTYTVQATRVSNQCSSSLEIIVEEDVQLPTATLTVDGLINCRDDNTQIRATQNSDYIYSWMSNDGSIIGGEMTSVATVTEGNYTVSITDQTNGCSDVFSTVVDADLRTLAAQAGPDQLLPCNNPNFSISGSTSPSLAGTGFTWYDPEDNIVSNQADFVPAGVGTFRLEVTHPETFCLSSDFVEITSEGPIDADLEIISPPCPEVGGQVLLENVVGGVGPYTVDFNGGIADTNLANVWTDVLPGRYTYTVTDQNGCSFSDLLEVSPGGIFTGTTQPVETTIGEPVQLGAQVNRPDSDIDSWTWIVGPAQQLSCMDCPNPFASSTESFTAEVIIEDIFGCLLALRQQVIVDARQIIYAPNAFSPGDQNGVNDRFTLFGPTNAIDAIESLTIYDRWGNTMWAGAELEINNTSQGWDGSFRGRPMGAQVFVYSARIRLFDGSINFLNGDFVLLR
ncbi:MAG: choice-of-anchor L domain-containing protein [Bacteroidota bacterium]